MLLKIFRVFCSIQMAVITLVGLAIALATATFLESAYDTKSAQFYVYRSIWFYGLLILLGVNILTVALSRFPWKKSHGPFLLAHVGILMLLFGSWMTFRFGVDAQMTVQEGETASSVELDESILTIIDGGKSDSIKIPWIPPASKFSPLSIPQHGLIVDQFISRADVQFSFENAPDLPKGQASAPAVQVKLKGGPLPMSQEMWLWAGDPAWSSFNMGPALFQIESGRFEQQAPSSDKAFLQFKTEPNGDLGYLVRSKSGKTQKGILSKAKANGSVIDPGWMGMTITIKSWIPHAENKTHFVPARVAYGTEVPGSAIRIKSVATGESLWLGLGSQNSIQGKDGPMGLIFANRRLILPFGIKLNRFQIDHYQGTSNPMSFSSKVQVAGGGPDQGETLISMNEPLHWGGYTFYQSSYVPDNPRPTISIFSVNRDPGRWIKYVGSLLIVFGTIWLFGRKYYRKKTIRKTA